MANKTINTKKCFKVSIIAYAILIIAGIAATIFLIWSFIKLYNLFDGFIIFFLFGGIMLIGGIIVVWVFVKVFIEEAINKCKSEIRCLKGK